MLLSAKGEGRILDFPFNCTTLIYFHVGKYRGSACIKNKEKEPCIMWERWYRCLHVFPTVFTHIFHITFPSYWKEQQEPEGKVRVSAVWLRNEVRAAPELPPSRGVSCAPRQGLWVLPSGSITGKLPVPAGTCSFLVAPATSSTQPVAHISSAAKQDVLIVSPLTPSPLGSTSPPLRNKVWIPFLMLVDARSLPPIFFFFFFFLL